VFRIIYGSSESLLIPEGFIRLKKYISGSKSPSVRYFMFIDESGEASVKKADQRFDLFSLCGIIFREDHYYEFDQALKEMKVRIFGSEDIVFRSFPMRNKNGKFEIFKDEEVLRLFYLELEKLIKEHEYLIISAIVDKPKYRIRYPTKNFAYEEALEFLCERAFFIKKKLAKDCTELVICLEGRNPDKNRLLKKHYKKLLIHGNSFFAASEFEFFNRGLEFRSKSDNINGLQFADICAYPILRAITSPERQQPTYELIKSKIHRHPQGGPFGYGIKIFP
jgi:hypothetical protein